MTASLGLLGVLLMAVVTVVALTVVYYVIRFAVRDGVVDAQRITDARRARTQPSRRDDVVS